MQAFFKIGYKFLIVLIAVIVLIGGYHVIKKVQNPIEKQSIPSFYGIIPKSEKVIITRSYIGQVEAINDTEIVPYISGYIVKINAAGGQFVKRGDILAVLKQEQYLAQNASAIANVYAAQADYANAKIKYKRMKKAGLQAVSATQLDDAKAAFFVAKANVQQARAELLNTETNLNYTYLTAPFDGVVGHIKASIGDYVSPPSQSLTRLVQFDPIRVVFSITDKEFLDGILKNDEKKDIQVRLQLANEQILPQSGKIKYSANAIDPQTDSLAVYAEFSNKNHQLIPNAYVNVLVDRPYENVILIEKNLLQMKENGNYVYTALNDVLTLHKLEILGEYNNKTAVINNFEKGETLIIDNVDERLVGHKINLQQKDAE